MLYENVMLGSYLALAHMLGPPPIIGISTVDGFMWTDDSMGSPSNLVYIPAIGPYTDHMTFFERLYNIYEYLLMKYFMK